tara:strand:- start:5469 stop:6131 length:663 start_codon:yes stop_codon:yes gene_type:complete
MLKRAFDIILSSIIIILFFPFGVIIFFILKFTGEGEVLYKQSRIGKNGNSFYLYKFATMIKDSPNLGAGDITLKNDPRVLPFGKFLRKTKLNEFPQFINVLKGQLSLVGPRPLVKNQYEMFPEKNKNIISKLKPGITGIGSIVFRDEEKYLHNNKESSNKFYKNEIIPFKAELENWYFKKESLFIDFILIIFTVIMIILPKSRFYNLIFQDIPKHKVFNP